MHDRDSKPSWQFLTSSCECKLGGARRLEQLAWLGTGLSLARPEQLFPLLLEEAPPESMWGYPFCLPWVQEQSAY